MFCAMRSAVQITHTVLGEYVASDIGFSWLFVHTKKEDLSCLTILILGRLKLSLDEDPDTSNILGESWGQFSVNLQKNCEVSIQHILDELCE